MNNTRPTGAQIAAARELADLKQKDFAADIGVTTTYMSHWESGLKLTEKRAVQILEYFKSLGIEFINEPGREGVIKRNGAI